MAIRLLGPLQVDHDGQSTSLARRDRIVLGALVIQRGEVVSAERLAEALWGDRPPPSWNKVVPGCVMRLRRVPGVGSIETSAHGYRLCVAAEDVDAHRFLRLVARGEELLTLGDSERAARVIGEALDLWRGRPLVDLEDWEPGRIEAARLDERRLDAEELRQEALLLACRYRDVLGEAPTLVAHAPLRERRWHLLAVAQYRAGRQGDALRTLHRARTVVATELGIEPGPDLTALEEAILRQDPALIAGPAVSEPSPTCPYKGLLAYDVEDAEWFFGRDAEVAACLQRLAALRVLAVVGPTGSGKSSLVRAGVAASLRRDGREVLITTPGQRPLDVLDWLRSAGPDAVMVIDQFEQVITSGFPADEISRLLDTLVERATRAPLVIALRADRLGDVSVHGAFARLFERGLHLLGPLADVDLRATIEGPAHQAGLLLEPGLVNLLVREVEGEAGALPLLSQALRQTWLRREVRTMTVAGYLASGGIRGAVSRSAEEIYERASDEQRRLIRALFLRLVSQTPGGEPVPTSVARRSVAADPESEHLVELLVDARLVTSGDSVVELSHESLARVWPPLRGWLDDDVEGQRTLRHLSGAADAWEAMGRPDSELYRGVRLSAATRWRNSADAQLSPIEEAFLDASELLADREAKVARRRRRRLVTALSCALVAAIALAASAVAQRRVAQRQARHATARELASTSALAVGEDPELAVLLALDATDAARAAGDEVPAELIGALHRAVQTSRLELRMDDGSVAVAFSPDGSRLATDSVQHTDAVLWDARTGDRLRTMSVPSGEVGFVAFSPDGTTLAVSSVVEDSRGNVPAVTLWDTSSGAEVGRLLGPARSYGEPVFSADGRLVAVPSSATGTQGRVTVWDVASGEERFILQPAGGAYELAFLESREELAVTEPNAQRVSLYSAVDGRPTTSLETTGLVPWMMAASPHGDRLLVGSNEVDAIQMWDLARRNAVWTTDSREPTALDWSNDGQLLAVANHPGSVQVLDAATGAELLSLRGADSAVIDVAFAPDSTRLASVSYDGELLVWDITTDGRPELDALAVGTRSAIPEEWAFSPDGAHVGVSLSTGAYNVFDAATGAKRTSLAGQLVQSGVYSVVPSPDWRMIASVDNDGHVMTRDLHTLAEVDVLPPCTTPKAFSPDGRLLVLDARLGCTVVEGVGGDAPFTAHPGTDLRSRVIDVRTGEVVVDLGQRPIFLAAFNPAGAFPAGRYLAINTFEGIDVFDLVSGAHLAVGEPGTVSMTLDPTGRFIATGTLTGAARVVDLAALTNGATLEQATVFDHTAHNGTITGVALTGDGTLATRAYAAVRLWDVSSGRLIVDLPTEPVPSGPGLTITPDDLYLVYSEGPVLRRYPLDLDLLRQTAVDAVTRNLSDDECRRYLNRDHCGGPR